MPASETGAPKQSDSVAERIARYEARGRKWAELARHRKGSTPTAPSPDGSRSGERIDRELRIAEVPVQYRDGDWATCRVADDLRAYVSSMEDSLARGKGVMLFGPTGTGKSTTAGLLCREAVIRRFAPRWSYAPDLRDLLKPTDGKRVRTMDRQRSADLLVWDDFAVGGLADWEIGWLDQIVEYRYQRRKPMVVTTNLTAQTLRDDARLLRMVDRWREMNMGVVVTGESMRDWWQP
jgi:DNA replication protein DnaC